MEKVNIVSIQARALYDYVATEDNELSFKEGEIISEIAKVDEGWWQGMTIDSAGNHSQLGLFPANYVEEIFETEQPHAAFALAAEPAVVPEAASGFSVRAVYAYTAGEENEITFLEGEIISRVDMVTEDW